MAAEAVAQPRFFQLHLQTRDGGVPVAGAQVRTTGRLEYRSDVNGNVAFYEPGLMNQSVWFEVEHPALQAPADGFGLRGKALATAEGGSGVVELEPKPDGGAGPVVTDDEQTQLLDASVPVGAARFRISFVDGQTQRGVPLVELRSATARWVSDSAGEVAFYDRPSMGQASSFTVFSHGYHLASDAGTLSLTPVAGGHATVVLARDNLAERLYRVTGGGVYADSALLELPMPLQQPVNNAGVMGQDSVLSTLYQGQAFFIWGDTNRAPYPLGNFFSTGARAQLPDAGGLAPSVGIDLQYIGNDAGFVKQMAPISGPGPVWMDGLTTVLDADGGVQLWAGYSKHVSLSEVAHRGLLKFDEQAQQFVVELTFDGGEPARISGHPFIWRFDMGSGVPQTADYVVGSGPVRTRALEAALTQPASYQAFTAVLADGGVARQNDGGIAYGWRAGGVAMSAGSSQKFALTADESIWEQSRDFATGEKILIHDNDTIAFNVYRDRFVRIGTRVGGPNGFLGDLYYQEGDTPMGPWVWGQKVVSHQRYTIYNPRHHPFLDENGGRTIYFEGTYTNSFSGNDDLTPRYDYNQVMYRLDLEAPALALPVPVYITQNGEFHSRHDLPPGQVPARPSFLAFDRDGEGLVPVALRDGPCEAGLLSTQRPPTLRPFFYGLAADFPADAGLGAQTVPFFECITDEVTYYGISVPDDCNTRTVMARVFPNPSPVRFDLDTYSGPVKAYGGGDGCLLADSPDGGYPVTVSAAGSRGRGEAIASYQWSGAGQTFDVRDATFILPAGLHTLTLVAVGEKGTTSVDDVTIEVRRQLVVETPKGCGCSSGAEALGVLPLLLSLLSRRRRR